MSNLSISRVNNSWGEQKLLRNDTNDTTRRVTIHDNVIHPRLDPLGDYFTSLFITLYI